MILYGFIFAFIIGVFSPIYAQIDDSTTLPDESYIENEVIVHFVPDYAPHDIQAELEQIETRQQTFLGKIRVWFDNILFSLKGVQPPDVRQAKLDILFDEAGVIDFDQMFNVEGQSQENTYLIKLDGSVSVLDAVELFEGVDEVEFAQPNYTYETYLQY